MSLIKNGANAVAKTAVKMATKVKASSPELMLAGGVVCVIAGVVVACKATQKASDIHDRAEANLAEIENCLEEYEDYTDEMAISDRRDVKRDCAIALVKCYLPVVALEAAGISFFLGSYGVMKKRNALLMSAYTALEDTFLKYRERVKNAVGEDRERKLYLGMRDDDDAPPFDTIDENGNPLTKKAPVADPLDMPSSSRIFDELNVNWKRDPLMNKMFLEHIQSYANEYLRMHGHLFLNQVYDWLGYEHTPEGAVRGWISEEKGGSGVVDFGVWDVWKEKVKDFQHGYEKSIILNFNLDPGVIWRKI